MISPENLAQFPLIPGFKNGFVTLETRTPIHLTFFMKPDVAYDFCHMLNGIVQAANYRPDQKSPQSEGRGIEVKCQPCG